MRSCPMRAVHPAALQVYAGPLEGGSRAVVLFNRHTATDPKFAMHNMTVFWKSIGLPPTERVRGTTPLAYGLHTLTSVLLMRLHCAGRGARRAAEARPGKVYRLFHRGCRHALCPGSEDNTAQVRCTAILPSAICLTLHLR